MNTKPINERSDKPVREDRNEEAIYYYGGIGVTKKDLTALHQMKLNSPPDVEKKPWKIFPCDTVV